MMLIVGGTGNVGRELVRLLAARGASFKVLTRSLVKAQELLGPTVALVEGDLAWPATLDAALDGVERVFLLSTNAPDQVELQGNLVRAARKRRLRHLVKVSGFRPSLDRTRLVGHWHAQTEAQIVAADLPYTFLQPSYFAQNLLLYTHPILHAGLLPTPTIGRIGFVDARDVAAVAAAVLTEAHHLGKTYVLTGPRALTFVEAASVLADAMGRRMGHALISYESAAAAFVNAGVPAWLTEYILSLYRAFDRGEGAEVTGDVERVTGAPPRDLAIFARDHAALFTGPPR